MALLLGYGAGAINPYLAFETIEDLIDQGVITGVTKRQAVKNFVKASTKGVLKIMSKMGISTVASLHGRPGVRGDRPVRGAGRRVLHRHHQPHQRRRARRARRGGRRAPPLRLPRPARGGRPPRPLGRRRVPVAPRGRAPPLQPGDGVQAPARHPHEALRHLQGVHDPRRRPGAAARHAARPLRARGRRAPAGPDRRGRAGQRDRQAVLHRRHELRLDLDGGARDARHRHEPPRRQVEHRRGRRGPRAAPRPASGAAPSSRWRRVASA